ncbi:hypothetical protein HDU96_002109, partial [Phlyctochytrium bullatum]
MPEPITPIIKIVEFAAKAVPDVITFIDKSITGRPVWGPTLELDAFTRISKNEYGVKLKLPLDGTVTLKVRRTEHKRTGRGRRVIAVTVKNKTRTKIGIRFNGPHGHNNIWRDDFQQDRRDDAFDADGWCARWDTLCPTCFCEIDLFRAGFLGFMDVIDGGIISTPGLKDLIDDGFNEVELAWTSRTPPTVIKLRTVFSLFGPHREADAATPDANVTPSKSVADAEVDGAGKASLNAETSTAHHQPHQPTVKETLNSLCRKGRTPLHAAVQSGSASLVDMLRFLDADDYKEDHNGTTPRLIFDALFPDPIRELYRRREYEDEIPPAHDQLQSGEKHRPDPALHVILRDWNRRPGMLARAVAEGKVGVDEVDRNGNSALHKAAKESVDEKAAKESVDEWRDQEGRHEHAIRELLAIGADPNLKNREGKIPLELAESLAAFRAFAEWVPNTRRSSDVFKAAAEGDLVALKLALGRNEDLAKVRESDRMTVLHCAAVHWQEKVVDLITNHCLEFPKAIN